MRINIRFWRTAELDKTPLDAIELSTRSIHALKRNKMFTFGDVLDRIDSREVLSELPSLGKACAIEIIRGMADYFISTLSDDDYARYIQEMKEINYGGLIANKAV